MRIGVSVRLYGDLRRVVDRAAPAASRVSLPEGATVADLIALFGLSPDEEVTPGVNGQLATRAALLNDGDEVLLFGPMEGG